MELFQEKDLIKIGVNLGILVISILTVSLLFWKLKFENKGYKMLFIFYTIFWIPLMLLRSYTTTAHNDIIDANGNQENSPNLGNYLTIAMCSYGIVGIFFRPLADFISNKLYSRKMIIWFALLAQFACYLPMFIKPSINTNIVQSIGVGIGASCIGLFQLMFNEQHGKSRQFLTVSILSIPPLMADFISSPIQSIVRTFQTAYVSNEIIGGPVHNAIDVSKYFWLIGIGFIVIASILSIFVREKASYILVAKTRRVIIKENSSKISLMFLILIGFTIAFVKFGNTGSIATTHLQNLDNKMVSSAYEGYISLIYSTFQLLGGILMGTVLIKRLGKTNTFLVGASFWLVFNIVSPFIGVKGGPYYMATFALNGFGYGILYNLVMGTMLNMAFQKSRKKRNQPSDLLPIGVYQGSLSIGISISLFLTNWIKDLGSKNEIWNNSDPNNPILNQSALDSYMRSNFIISFVFAGVILFISSIFIIYSLWNNNWSSKKTFSLKRNVKIAL